MSPPSLDQYDWWRNMAPMLGKMLYDAKYSLCQQFEHLYLFGTHIIPMLGPFPTSRPGLYKCILGGLGPLEFSQNWTKQQATVRIAFEPTSAAASTGDDPCNRLMINEALNRLKQLRPQVDLQLYHQLITSLTVTDEEQHYLSSRHELDSQPSKTQTILALDLKGSDLSVKLYFYPLVKCAATGTPISQLAFSAIRKVDDGGVFRSPLAMIEDFLSGAPSTTSVCFVSCDLVAPSKTRFKLYVAEFQVDFARISDIWTLGGRLGDEETLTGLSMLRELWGSLGIPEGLRSFPERPTQAGDSADKVALLFNLEIQPHKSLPQPKAYLPLTGINDEVIARTITHIFEKWGWSEHSKSYTENLESYRPEIDLKRSTDFQAWLSFSYSKITGPYLTIYYH
ncbi:putative dimethylallyl tryptophan synthase [Aspergillus alliaceus]|uniref:putative dimethylallyl tryptophan synthase n=1 Tax=Petromyces alliaceus TaxID=209559 RepID=UPI0012A6900F|nr:putative dimethylallyl tryptophan synthase [Aspergillus alliaceus]KAB8233937.1 putative dimethylallyl tryptophan synthase [Aspergillus alliaceus]